MLRIMSLGLLVGLTAGWLAKADDGLSLNRERFGHAVVSVGGDLYVLGGAANEGMAAELERLGPDRSAWEVIGEMPNPRYWVDAVTDGPVVYVAGGTRLGEEGANPIVDTFEKWDPATGEWTTLAPLPVPRAHVALAWLDGHLFAIGGATEDRGRSSQVDRYDPETDTWSSGAEMPTARECDVVAYEGRLYAVGGYDGRSSVTAFEVYDPKTDQWEKLPDLPFLLSAHHAVVVDGVLYTFGHYQHPERVAAYDFDSREWSLIDLPYQPSRHNDVVYDGREVFVIGGNVSGAAPYLNLVQRFPVEQLRSAPRRPAGDEEALEVELAKPFVPSPETEAVLVAWGEKLAAIQTLSGDWVQTFLTDESGEIPVGVYDIRFDRESGNIRFDNNSIETLVTPSLVTLAVPGTRRYFQQEKQVYRMNFGNRALLAMLGVDLLDLGAVISEDPVAALRAAAVEHRWVRAESAGEVSEDTWVLKGKVTNGSLGTPQGEVLYVDSKTGLILRQEVTRLVESRSEDGGATETQTWVQVVESTGVEVNEPIDPDVFVFEPDDGWERVDARDALFPQPDRSRFELSGKPAPELTLPLLNGETFQLADATGKVVVLDFWATWCGPCVMALPEVQALHEAYGTGDVVVVGVSTDDLENEKTVREMVSSKKLTYRIGIDTNRTKEAYFVSGIPTLVLIDRQGIVQGRKVGFSSTLAKTLGEQVEQLLAGETLPGGIPLTEGEEPEGAVYHQPVPRPNPRYFETIWEGEEEPMTPSRRTMFFLNPIHVMEPPGLLTIVGEKDVKALDPATGHPVLQLTYPIEEVPENRKWNDQWTCLRRPDAAPLLVRFRNETKKAMRNGREYQTQVASTLTAFTDQGTVEWAKDITRSTQSLTSLPAGPAEDWLVMVGFSGVTLFDYRGSNLGALSIIQGQSLQFFDQDGDGRPEVHILGGRSGAYRLKMPPNRISQ